MGRFFWAALVIGLVSQTSAHGQRPPFNQPTKLDRTTGVVEAVAPGMVQVLDAHGGRWMVAPAPNSRVSVRGDTTRDMLQKGQAVSCEVMLDDAGKVTEPVKTVVFTDGVASGVAPAAGLGAEPGAGPAKPPRGKRPAGAYIVSGSIKMTKDDSITVMAGKERFEIPVAPEAVFTIETANVGLATKGDAAEIEGMYMQKGQLQATLLQIKLANPVIPPPPKGRPRPKAPIE